MCSQARDAAKLRDSHSNKIIGTRLLAEGSELYEQTRNAVGIRQMIDGCDFDAIEKPTEDDRRLRQITSHLEKEIFAAGRGEVRRTHLILAALVQRPAVKALLHPSKSLDTSMSTMTRMLENARETLCMLQNKTTTTRNESTYEKATSRKTRSQRIAFEAIVDALTPDDASSTHLVNCISKLLGVNWDTVNSSLNRKRARSSDEEDESIAALEAYRK